MVVSAAIEPPDLVVATLSGVITEADQGIVIAAVRKAIRDLGQIRLLVVLESFAGWQQAAFADQALWLRDDEGVTRIAIVGAPERRVEILTAVGQPLRLVPIQYFSDSAEARRWLTTGALSV